MYAQGAISQFHAFCFKHNGIKDISTKEVKEALIIFLPRKVGKLEAIWEVTVLVDNKFYAWGEFSDSFVTRAVGSPFHPFYLYADKMLTEKTVCFFISTTTQAVQILQENVIPLGEFY